MMTDEMVKLRKYLDEENIKWVDCSGKMRQGLSINRTHFKHGKYDWSVIHGLGTYGQSEGLLEVMSDAFPGSEPIGWLTAEQVMEKVKNAK